jgi:hypothetical protein
MFPRLKKLTFKNMKFKINILLFILFSTFGYSQTWINNNLTEYFKNRYVENFVVIDSVIWINGVGLTKYDGHQFITYNLSSYSEGPLDNYISEKGSEIFDNVISNEGTIYLYDSRHGVILKIINDFIYRYDKSVLKKRFKDVSIDEDKSIWLLMKNIGDYVSKFKIYKISKDSKKIYSLPDKYDKYILSNFFIYKANKYVFLHMRKDSCTENLLLIVNKKSVIKKFVLNPYYGENLGHKYFCLSDKVYILNGEGAVYKVTNGADLESFNIPDYKGSNEEYSFVVKNQDIYCFTGNFSSDATFFRYNMDNKIVTPLPLPDNPPNLLDRKKSFLNMGIYKDMLIGRDGNYEGGNGILLFKD